MPKATRTEIWNTSCENIFAILRDYSSYPEFVGGCSEVKIFSQSEKGADVEFSLNLIKKFKYRLKLEHDFPTSLKWTLESGDLFKKNEGSWALKDLGEGKTQVTYTLDVEIKGLVPKRLISSLAEKNLPSMLKSYRDRCIN